MLAGENDMIDPVVVLPCIFMETESSEMQAEGIVEKVGTVKMFYMNMDSKEIGRCAHKNCHCVMGFGAIFIPVGVLELSQRRASFHY
jgi:hypothetical protein